MVLVVWFLVNSWSSVLFPIQIFFFPEFQEGHMPLDSGRARIQF